jgi:hypothetical protein
MLLSEDVPTYSFIMVRAKLRNAPRFSYRFEIGIGRGSCTGLLTVIAARQCS